MKRDYIGYDPFNPSLLCHHSRHEGVVEGATKFFKVRN